MTDRLKELAKLDGDWSHWLEVARQAQAQLPIEVKRNRLASSSYRQRKPKIEASYEGLEGKWLEWLEVAKRFEHKAKAEDRLDLKHNIMVAFADQQARNERLGKPDLSFFGMLRIASHCVADYWREQRRNGRLIDLNMLVTDDEGNSIELIDTLADDTVDLEAWLEVSTWELGYPKRLAEIGNKLDNKEALSAKDRMYLSRYRHKYQKRLF